MTITLGENGSANQLRADLASTASAALGDALVGVLQPFTGAVPRTQHQKNQDWVSAKDFGVVGDGTTDDTVGFTAACAYAISSAKVLDISDLKIYLSTQAASITSTGLVLRGSGRQDTGVPVEWTFMAGTNPGGFETIKTAVLALPGSAIFSKYNGPIFTGQTFRGSDFSVYGYSASAANSQMFKTTTATTYPGWSQAIAGLERVSGFYFGSHGIELQAGLEVATLRDITVAYCGGYCIKVTVTTLVNSPVEYVDFINCVFSNGLLGNVYLKGVKKHIGFDNCQLNDPGQLNRLNAQQIPIIYPIWIQSASGDTSASYQGVTVGCLTATNIKVINCYAENTQGLVTFEANTDFGGYTPFYTQLTVENNNVFYHNGAWPYYNATFNARVNDLHTAFNQNQSGVAKFYFAVGGHSFSGTLGIDEFWSENGATLSGARIGQNQLLNSRVETLSGTIGSGSAATFTYDASDSTFLSPPTDTSSVVRLLLITATFQGGTSSPGGGGAYLMAVVRNPFGEYIGTTVAFGSVAGFSAAPTMSTVGVISCPMSAYYRARVSRIDHLPANLLSY